MPTDDVGEFLKFLDDVSLQLACLLDIDGDRDLKRIYGKQRVPLGSISRAKIGKSCCVSATQTSKKQLKVASKQSTRLRGRRKSKQECEDHLIEPANKQHSPDRNQTNPIAHRQQQQQQQHHHHHPDDYHNSKPLGIVGAETHPLEVQLSLSLTDELNIEHGPSISPATHLSPMEPSPLGHFNHTISSQPHYYNPARGTLDSFHLQEEFSSHEHVPITSEPTHQLVVSPDDHHHQHHHHHHHSIVHHHQQQQQQQQQQHQPGPHLHNQHQLPSQEGSGAGQSQQQQHLSSLNDGTFSTIPTMSDCYTQPPIMHHHGSQQQHHHHHNHSHQQHQHQHQNPQHQHHQPNLQYQALDHQWLSSSSLTGDSNIHILEPHNHNSIEHVVPMSPGANQNLEHVQFGSSLYHHNYYNHQTDHLDPFHQMTGDDFNPNSATLINEGNQIHRLHQDQQRQQQQQTQLNNGNPNSNNYDHSNQMHQNRSGNHQQLPNSSASYNNEHQHNSRGHSQHHSLTQMPHLVSGIEPSNVIIQDINLASATWNSSEDLYTI